MKKILLIMLTASLLSCGPDTNGNSIRLAMEDDILTLDPYGHDESVTHSVLANIYDGLVAFDPEMRITPALAVRWENPNDLVWRFFLRPGVKFHNGKNLRAGDVKYSLDLARQGKAGHYLSPVSEVRVVDSLTVDIITRNPAPVLLNKLTFICIVPEGSNDLAAKPMGTGAYRFVDYQKGRTLELTANQDYWKGKPPIKKAVFVVLSNDSARCRELLDGRLQLIRDTGERYADLIKNDPRVKFLSRPGLGVTLLGVNFKIKGPLLNQKVRRAIYLALDPSGLIRDSRAEADPTDQLVTPFIVGYLPDMTPQRPLREQAKKLLKEAGYPDGFTIDLEMSETAALRNGPYIAQQLGLVGIKVNIKGLVWQEMFQRVEDGKSQFFLVGWSNSSGDASDLLEGCLHSEKNGRYGSANWGYYSNPRLDRLVEQSQSTIDSRERTLLMQQAMRIALEDMPLIPLYVRSRTYGASSRIDFLPRQDARIKIFEISYLR